MPENISVQSSDALSKQELEEFKTNGFLNLGQILPNADVARFEAMFDRDRTQYPYMWHPYGYYQEANYEALISSPEFDGLIRHPSIFPKINALMGGPVCFGEIGLRSMKAYEGKAHQAWHRDRGYWFEHPLRLDYMQLIVYLTDVNDDTHCFSILPESIHDTPTKHASDHKARKQPYDLYGQAGTCALFNVALFHTASTRPTKHERKSVQIYYGHANRAPLANDSGIPTSLSRHPENEETRAFYGNLNERSKLYMRAYGQ